MSHKKLSQKQRNFLADKLMDTANFAVVGLVFGQMLLNAIRPVELIFGIVFYLWILNMSLSWLRG